MTTAAPPAGLSDHFAWFVAGLCGLFGHYEARDPTGGPFVFLIRGLLRRRVDRFAALVARFRAGGVAAMLPRHATSMRRAYDRAWSPMPTERGWLWHLVPGVADHVARFEDMLAAPEMAALIAAGPQAGRLLRPLWRMMTAQPLPAVLRTVLLRRTRAPQPDASPGATPDALEAGGPAAMARPRLPRPPPRPHYVRWIAPLPARDPDPLARDG